MSRAAELAKCLENALLFPDHISIHVAGKEITNPEHIRGMIYAIKFQVFGISVTEDGEEIFNDRVGFLEDDSSFEDELEKEYEDDEEEDVDEEN